MSFYFYYFPTLNRIGFIKTNLFFSKMESIVNFLSVFFFFFETENSMITDESILRFSNF